ncbi:Pr6Pr family membrane protein [Amnibacterium sp.]|uniref:Pr6Pr family membrane protein n=1 Tax=Amnibacterium sp. TaxID=1872496 RepID=UPI002602151B|nr:Pr6Pr family membrane protein [Amnibacterium sp.]MCU1472517.1 hypothetical protein [Amnibacterium sp.]
MSARTPLETGETPSAVAAPTMPAPFIRALAAGRLAAGGLMITAIGSQLVVSLGYWHRIGIRDVGLRIADFFSAFTHQGILAGGAILIIGGVLLLRGTEPMPRWLTVLRLAVLPSILVAGIVYNLLLRQLPVPPGSQLDWANEVMHVVAPIAVALDWLIAPHPAHLRFRTAWVVAVFPVAWVAYTFVRGPLVPDEINRTQFFYPYGFLDPHAAGWAPVVQLVVELLAFAVILGFAAVLAWRIEDHVRTRRRRARESDIVEA